MLAQLGTEEHGHPTGMPMLGRLGPTHWNGWTRRFTVWILLLAVGQQSPARPPERTPDGGNP